MSSVRVISMCIQTVLFGLNGLYKRKRRGERERVKKEENQVGKGGLLGAGKVRGLYDQHVASPYKIYKK